MSKSFNSNFKNAVSNTRKKFGYSPFQKDSEVFLRNGDGECFKASFHDGNFVWVDIDPQEFLAANDPKH